MKKMYFAVLTALAIIGLTSSQAWAAVYSQNNYLQPIQYVQQPTEIAHMVQPETLGNGSRVELRRQGLNVATSFNAPQQNLSIRTVGGRYSDISYLFNQINNEQASHGDAKAIIMINPSYGIYGWNIAIAWEGNDGSII